MKGKKNRVEHEYEQIVVEQVSEPIQNKKEEITNMATATVDPKTSIMVNMPLSFKLFIVEKATEAQVPTSAYTRQVIATALGFTLEPNSIGRVKKYASEEERTLAQKNREKGRRNLIKDLMDKFKSGQLNLADITNDPEALKLINE